MHLSQLLSSFTISFLINYDKKCSLKVSVLSSLCLSAYNLHMYTELLCLLLMIFFYPCFIIILMGSEQLGCIACEGYNENRAGISFFGRARPFFFAKGTFIGRSLKGLYKAKTGQT